jgi:putative DNA primase/helicase
MLVRTPHPLLVLVDHIPAELQAYWQWVAWMYVLRGGKWTKVPINPKTGREAKSNDPRTWASLEIALSCAQRDHLAGVGFVFTDDDPYAGVDLDHCRNPETGEIAAWAEEIIASLNTYTEISPSGTGVKSFVRASIPPGGNRRAQIELYDHSRYFTVTGHYVAGTPPTIEARQSIIENLHARLFPTPQPAQRSLTDDHRPRRGTEMLADDALLAQAMAARNGVHFARLWGGAISGYPSHSEADLALCSLLAFWCGPDPERIDRLFQQSKLYRTKWHRRHYADGRTYGAATIALALTRREWTKVADRNILDRLAIRPASTHLMARLTRPAQMRHVGVPSRPCTVPLEGMR